MFLHRKFSNMLKMLKEMMAVGGIFPSQSVLKQCPNALI